jgi:hypothetical protein
MFFFTFISGYVVKFGYLFIFDNHHFSYITNLLDFISYTNFMQNSIFIISLKKLHKFRAMVNMNDIFTYLIF